MQTNHTDTKVHTVHGIIIINQSTNPILRCPTEQKQQRVDQPLRYPPPGRRLQQPRNDCSLRASIQRLAIHHVNQKDQGPRQARDTRRAMRRKEVALVQHRRTISAVKIIQLVDRANGGNLIVERVVQVDGDPGRHLTQRRLVHDVHNGREVAHLGGVEHGDDVLVVEGLGAVVAAPRLDLVEQRLVLVPDARVDGGREVGVLVGQADGAGGDEARVLAAVDLVDDGGHVGRDAADGRADNLELRRVRLMELGGPCGGRGARGVSPHGDFRVVADSGQ